MINSKMLGNLQSTRAASRSLRDGQHLDVILQGLGLRVRDAGTAEHSGRDSQAPNWHGAPRVPAQTDPVPL